MLLSLFSLTYKKIKLIIFRFWSLGRIKQDFEDVTSTVGNLTGISHYFLIFYSQNDSCLNVETSLQILQWEFSLIPPLYIMFLFRSLRCCRSWSWLIPLSIVLSIWPRSWSGVCRRAAARPSTRSEWKTTACWWAWPRPTWRPRSRPWRGWQRSRSPHLRVCVSTVGVLSIKETLGLVREHVHILKLYTSVLWYWRTVWVS